MFIIEVGANSGEDTNRFLEDGAQVLAFEPNPFLYKQLINRFGQYIDEGKLDVFSLAVSDFNGEAMFNVSEIGDRGTSSLFKFHENLLQTPLDMFMEFTYGFSSEVRVEVIRLDDFLYGTDDIFPNVIDYIHIDAQGSDFKVIKGLGKKLADLKAGRCEATCKINLYNNDDGNRQEDIKYYLEKHGFEIWNENIHPYHSEVDLEFRRK